MLPTPPGPQVKRVPLSGSSRTRGRKWTAASRRGAGTSRSIPLSLRERSARGREPTGETRVVGEGIETAAQLERLRALGCDVGQGYHFSRPLPKKDVDELFARNPRYP